MSDYPIWLRAIAVRIAKHVSNQSIRAHFESKLTEWSIDEDAVRLAGSSCEIASRDLHLGGHNPDDIAHWKRGLTFLPDGSVSLLEKYAMLSAIHNVVCEPARIALLRPAEKTVLNGASLIVLEADVTHIVDAHRDDLEAFLRDVESDLVRISAAPSASALAETTEERNMPDPTSHRYVVFLVQPGRSRKRHKLTPVWIGEEHIAKAIAIKLTISGVVDYASFEVVEYSEGLDSSAIESCKQQLQTVVELVPPTSLHPKEYWSLYSATQFEQAIRQLDEIRLYMECVSGYCSLGATWRREAVQTIWIEHLFERAVALARMRHIGVELRLRALWHGFQDFLRRGTPPDDADSAETAKTKPTSEFECMEIVFRRNQELRKFLDSVEGRHVEDTKTAAPNENHSSTTDSASNAALGGLATFAATGHRLLAVVATAENVLSPAKEKPPETETKPPRLEDPIPIPYIRKQLPISAVKGDAYKLKKWFSARKCRMALIANRWYIERADALAHLKPYRRVCTLIKQYGQESDGD